MWESGILDGSENLSSGGSPGHVLEAGEGLEPEAAGVCQSLQFLSSTCATASGKL